jgi:hypothetical protein
LDRREDAIIIAHYIDRSRLPDQPLLSGSQFVTARTFHERGGVMGDPLAERSRRRSEDVVHRRGDERGLPIVAPHAASSMSTTERGHVLASMWIVRRRDA